MNHPMNRYGIRASTLALSVGIAVAMLTPTVASAEVVMCGGEEATIVGDGNPIEGTDGADVIVGTDGRDVINGNGGDDIICGLGGADTINGGDGDDAIWGQGGNDTIRGNRGDDLIRPGRGNDRAWGNGGHDKIWAFKGSDVCVAEEEWSCELDKRWGHDPDDWLPLLDEYFGDIGETANARIILGCESRGEPFIRGPETQWGRAMGLFQFIPGTWDQWNPETPVWAGESPFHPEANIATARRLYDAYVDWDGRWGWTPWSCNRLLDPPS